MRRLVRLTTRCFVTVPPAPSLRHSLFPPEGFAEGFVVFSEAVAPTGPTRAQTRATSDAVVDAIARHDEECGYLVGGSDTGSLLGVPSAPAVPPCADAARAPAAPPPLVGGLLTHDTDLHDLDKVSAYSVDSYGEADEAPLGSRYPGLPQT